MPRTMKPESTPMTGRESSFVSLLSGWVQQGVENFFATQRILVDLALRQNANAMKFFQDRMEDRAFRPAAILTDLASDGINNFIEGQKLLLNLAQKEYHIVSTGVKERVGTSAAAVAMTDAMRRSFDTFVEMQQDFLKIATKQTHAWLESVKAGKGYDAEALVEMARESFDTFVHTQKKFLDVIAEETSNATHTVTKKMKKTELMELAMEATGAFVEAHKKLADVAGKQVNANLKAANRTMEMVAPFAVSPLPDITRQGVKTFVDTEKAIIDSVTRVRREHKEPMKGRARRKGARRTIKLTPVKVTA